MKDMLVEDVVEQVRICLDQNMTSKALADLGNVDTLSLDELIWSKIEDAALSVVLAAPVFMLDDISVPIGNEKLSIEPEFPHAGIVELPSDYARLVMLKLSGWQYPIYEVLPPHTSLYAQANSGFNVFGTKDRPVVFLVPTQYGKRLEVYCASNRSDTIENCLYVPKPKMRPAGLDGSETDGMHIKLGDDLERPTIYYAAYLTAMAVNDDNAAAKLLGVAKDKLGINE